MSVLALKIIGRSLFYASSTIIEIICDIFGILLFDKDYSEFLDSYIFSWICRWYDSMHKRLKIPWGKF